MNVNDTRELVDAGQIGVLLAALSGLALLLAPPLLAASRRPGRSFMRKTGLTAAAGTLLFPLWLVYNAIEDSLGLDSVAGLLGNLALFVTVGVVVGRVMRRFWPAGEPSENEN